MPTQLVGRAVARVRAAGGDADALIQAHDLPRSVETDPFVLLSMSRLRAVLDAAERAARDPFLGVSIACSHDDGNVIAFACRGAPDLRSALTRCIGLITSFNQQLSVTFEERGGRGRIDMTVADQPLGFGRHGNEYWVTAFLLQARLLSTDPCVPERAWLAHPAPRDTSELERVLGTSRLKFGAESTGFTIATRVLDAPLRTADPLLRGLPAASSAPSGAGPARRRAERSAQLNAPFDCLKAPTLAPPARRPLDRQQEPWRNPSSIALAFDRDARFADARSMQRALREAARGIVGLAPEARAMMPAGAMRRVTSPSLLGATYAVAPPARSRGGRRTTLFVALAGSALAGAATLVALGPWGRVTSPPAAVAAPSSEQASSATTAIVVAAPPPVTRDPFGGFQ